MPQTKSRMLYPPNQPAGTPIIKKQFFIRQEISILGCCISFLCPSLVIIRKDIKLN